MRSVLRLCVQCQETKRTEPGRRVCNSCRAQQARERNRVRMRRVRQRKRDALPPLTEIEQRVLSFLRTQGSTPRYDDIMAACQIKSYAHMNRIVHSLRDKKKIGYVSRRIWVLPEPTHNTSDKHKIDKEIE